MEKKFAAINIHLYKDKNVNCVKKKLLKKTGNLDSITKKVA